MSIKHIQEKVQAITSVTAPTGAATATAGALTLNEWLAIGGFVLAFLSFLINWHYQQKRYVLDKKRAFNDE